MNPTEKLKTLCIEKLTELDKLHLTSRLKEELDEVSSQEKANYFLDLANSDKKYFNENNLLISYLLNISPNYEENKPPVYNYGEYPDIDVDYLPELRDYLKKEFAPEIWGNDHVCNIATYSRFDIKSVILDMARVLGLDADESHKITKPLGSKDDDGEKLTWHQAIKLYPELKDYLEKNVDLADAAFRLLHRVRGIGMHASGLIISEISLPEFVPLIRPRDGEGLLVSAWVEGQSDTDLSTVGLIKFDFLSINCIAKIADTLKLYAEKNDGKKISNLPGQGSFSDLSYLEDPKSLAMANEGKLKMVFQFDGSAGIRNLAKMGGVSSFNDLVVYTSVFRPASLDMKMHERYIERKYGREDYKVHPLIDKLLEETYGVMIYQEQVAKILNQIGGIPLKDCEAVRKAISKKKIDKFMKYKELFLLNSQRNLGWNLEQVEFLWDQIESFAGYGFNKCIPGDSLIFDPVSEKVHTVDYINKNFTKEDFYVQSLAKSGKIEKRKILAVYDNGKQKIFKVSFSNCNNVRCTINHKFLTLTKDGFLVYKPLGDIAINDLVVSWSFLEEKLIYNKVIEISTFLTPDEPVYDIEVEENHNFVLGGTSGPIVHNSHAVAYTYNSMRTLYLKANYPQYFCPAYLKNTELKKPEDYVLMKDYLNESRSLGVKIERLNLNNSGASDFNSIGDAFYYPFEKIKTIGEDTAEKIASLQPYSGLIDFISKFGTGAKVLTALVNLELFTEGNPKQLMAFVEAYKDFITKKNAQLTRGLKSLDIDLKKIISIFPQLSHHVNSSNFWQLAERQYVNANLNDKKIRLIIRKHLSDKSRKKEFICPKIEDFLKEDLIFTKTDRLQAEADFYGFPWLSKLEMAKGYSGRTFSEYESLEMSLGPVEVEVVSCKQKTSKAKGTVYYSLSVVDAMQVMKTITIWEDDYKLFSHLFVQGKMLRLSVKPPVDPYPGYSLASKWQVNNEFRVVELKILN